MDLPQRIATKARDRKLDEQDQTLAEFVSDFIDEHAVEGSEGGEIVLDVSREEYETVGRSIIRILVGWAAGLNGSRRRRGILPARRHDEYLEEFSEDKEVPIH